MDTPLLSQSSKRSSRNMSQETSARWQPYARPPSGFTNSSRITKITTIPTPLLTRISNKSSYTTKSSLLQRLGVDVEERDEEVESEMGISTTTARKSGRDED